MLQNLYMNRRFDPASRKLERNCLLILVIYILKTMYDKFRVFKNVIVRVIEYQTANK